MENDIPLDKFFLDEKMNLQVEKIRKENSADYNTIYTLLNFSYNILQEFSNKEHDNFDIYLYSSYMQFIKYLQAYYILIERGLPEAAQSLLRSIHEYAFRICAACLDPSIIDYFFAETIKSKQNIVKRINSLNLYHLIPQDKIIELLEIYKKELDKNPFKKLPKLNLAQKADLEEQYIFFQYLSSFVHCDLDCSDFIIKWKENSVLIDGNLNYKRIHDDIGISIYIYNQTTLKLLDALKMDKYKTEYEQISKNLKEFLN